MRKLFVILVAVFLMASSAYAFVQGENGEQNIETVYVTAMGRLVSGDVVVLKTTSPTYIGREVTGTTTQGNKIFGVVLGEYDIDACRTGTWIRVQTYGYCPIVKVTTDPTSVGGAFDVAAGDSLVTSGVALKAKTNGAGVVSGGVVAMEAYTPDAASATVKAYIK